MQYIIKLTRSVTCIMQYINMTVLTSMICITFYGGYVVTSFQTDHIMVRWLDILKDRGSSNMHAIELVKGNTWYLCMLMFTYLCIQTVIILSNAPPPFCCHHISFNNCFEQLVTTSPHMYHL